MLINKVEINKGDCVVSCATEPGGYHYMLGFAFKAEDIIDGKVRCMFHEISFDDFVIRDYPELHDLEDMYLPPAYEVYVVTEDAMNKFISQVQDHDLDEDEVWEYFVEARKFALRTVYKDPN